MVTYAAVKFTSSIHPATMVTPYVDIENVTVSGEGLIIKLAVINAMGNLTITGGYANIIETGQSAPLSVAGPLTLEARYPLLPPQYVNLSTIGVKGLVSGTFYGGDPMYIGFFLVAPVSVRINVWVSNVKYSDCILDITLSYSTPIPLVISELTNATLVDDTQSSYVFYVIGNIPVRTYISPGINNTVITINLSKISSARVFTCSLISGHTYTLYLPITVTYMYPTTNVTNQLTLYNVFRAGG
ncbi:hypothetical protein [Vulcanisaeta distributa]|uniref:hypothetical protein n=1 Tax=Vulcanisaeta distributa TaxID=164451 RepID=UPI001FB400FE|nr:hypothetical protein [Vulcanisaeta distributa]